MDKPLSTSQIALLIITFFIFIAFSMWGCPVYKVWRQGKQGEAELRRAEQNRKIKIQEAAAIQESSKMLAAADTVRAHGIARSQQIINKTLTPGYLHWFWIDNIDKSNNVMYIATEAGLPIMEAGRFFKQHADSIANANENE